MENEPIITKDKTSDEILKESIEFLDTMMFNFACFIDSYKRYVEKVVGND